ncbi:MAG: TetR/AcrR family transcriptional regulator [Clostridia bacterium]
MPTDTFKKLSEEKKNKIIQAAKKEFARVPLAEASIKNIVEEAGIARGSFYQYFESKEDILLYILQDQKKNLRKKLEETLEKTKGDIFKTFLAIYDTMDQECHHHENGRFYRKIFQNIKASEDNLFSLKMEEPKQEEFYEMYQAMDTTKLKIKEKEEIALLIKMLHSITRAALANNAMCQNKEKARKDYIQQLQYLKYGVSTEVQEGQK